MKDPAYTVFIAFGCIWIVMGITAVILLLKSDNQKIRFGKWGLIVGIPIIVPIVLVLLYQIFRPFILQTFL